MTSSPAGQAVASQLGEPATRSDFDEPFGSQLRAELLSRVVETLGRAGNGPFITFS